MVKYTYEHMYAKGELERIQHCYTELRARVCVCFREFPYYPAVHAVFTWFNGVVNDLLEWYKLRKHQLKTLS